MFTHNAEMHSNFGTAEYHMMLPLRCVHEAYIYIYVTVIPYIQTLKTDRQTDKQTLLLLLLLTIKHY